MKDDTDEEELLSILHAHGQQFLRAFDISTTPRHETKNSSGGSESEEEWLGLSPPHNRSTSDRATYDENSGSEHNNDLENSSRTPDVAVFVESARRQSASGPSARGLRKSFMSSKVSNITSTSLQATSKENNEESDDERTNSQNDALLHRLVHTKLLSGSFNPELRLNHAQRGHALAGRVLELAGKAKLGKGESIFRQEQRNRAAKNIRDGLNQKRKEQEQRALEEAKSLGNYHPALKRLYDSNPSSAPKKRARGLGLGVGRFDKGILKLSKEEIASITGSGTRSRVMRQRPR